MNKTIKLNDPLFPMYLYALKYDKNTSSKANANAVVGPNTYLEVLELSPFFLSNDRAPSIIIQWFNPLIPVKENKIIQITPMSDKNPNRFIELNSVETHYSEEYDMFSEWIKYERDHGQIINTEYVFAKQGGRIKLNKYINTFLNKFK